MFSIFKFGIFAALMAILPVVATAGEGGAVLLTVTGDISKPDRGGYNANVDKFFGYHEVEFTKGAEFSFDDLVALGMTTAKADFPQGADVHVFEGPLLADVLSAAGGAGETVTVQALDGYAVEAPLAELVAQGAIIAVMRDGQPMGIGGFGPSQLVFPRAERGDLAEMNDDRWVWSIFHIRVE